MANLSLRFLFISRPRGFRSRGASGFGRRRFDPPTGGGIIMHANLRTEVRNSGYATKSFPEITPDRRRCNMDDLLFQTIRAGSRQYGTEHDSWKNYPARSHHGRARAEGCA